MEQVAKRRIEVFCDTNAELSGFSIELIKFGYNRSVFLLYKPGGDRLVAKIGNKTKDSGSSNTNDVMVQSYLNEQRLEFVPQIVYWDKQQDIHIETYVGDKDEDANNLNNDGLDTFARQLFVVHNLSVDDFIDSSTKKGFEKPKLTTPVEDLQIFGFDRFEIAKKHCRDSYVINWLDSRLQQNKEDLEIATVANPHLKWGDIGENLRISDNKLFFIDWEFGGLGYGSELAYIKIHSHLSDKKYRYLLSRYAKYSKRNVDELSAEVLNREKVIRTNDVVWAAMKWSQSKTLASKQKFKDLTYKRIQLAELSFK